MRFIERLKKYFKAEKRKSRKEEILEMYEKIELPKKPPLETTSWEYRVFKKEEKLARMPRNLYEKLCNLSEKILPVEPDEATKRKIEHAIKLAHLHITPVGAASLTLLTCAAISGAAFLLILSKLLFGIGLSLGYGLLTILFAVLFSYYLYIYPLHLERRYLAKIGSEITMMILYMVIYLRNSPNLEGAIEFAARNLSGELAFDLRKILWDVEVGIYTTVDEALIDYLLLWQSDRYFVEAIQLMRTSLEQPEDKRIAMLDEAVNLVLSGTHEKAKNFAQQMKMPILMIHALGILLPVMGLVLFPIIGIFLDVRSEILFIGYDVLLPLAVYFFIYNVLEVRPVTISQVTMEEHPNMPPPGKFALGRFYVPVSLAAALAASPLLLMGTYFYFLSGSDNLYPSLIITLGMVVFAFLFYFLSSFQRIRIREEITKVEQEFTEALFQLGNQVSTGAPVEIAIERATRSIGELSIKRFFDIILRNMRNLGMTFREAVFDEEYGAVLYYPSRLIKSVMRIIVDSAKKGIGVAALTMLSISRHLKNLAETQTRIHDMLSDVVSSLRFQAFLLTPLIAGIIVTMAAVIIGILNKLTSAVKHAAITGETGYITPFLPWGKLHVTPGEFQLICALYFIETSILISTFINWIENGGDEIYKQRMAARVLAIGSVVYFISFFVSYGVFAPITIGGL